MGIQPSMNPHNSLASHIENPHVQGQAGARRLRAGRSNRCVPRSGCGGVRWADACVRLSPAAGLWRLFRWVSGSVFRFVAHHSFDAVRQTGSFVLYIKNRVAKSDPCKVSVTRTDLDTDNIIKPIQDALEAILYDDDKTVVDVCARKINLYELPTIVGAPDDLLPALDDWSSDFVFIRLAPAHRQVAFA